MFRWLAWSSGKTDLMRFYRKAHIFIFPSYHEGFPRVLYEAMINSLPIVTTMVGGISGRMVDGENCIGIPAKSAGAIVEAVERVTRRFSAASGHWPGRPEDGAGRAGKLSASLAALH